jgi:hypothetical protein
MTPREINELLFSFRPLLSRADVVSIDIRPKTTRGRRTGDPALVVGVANKLPRDAVPPGALIPDRVRVRTSRGVVELPTDVVDEGVIRPLAVPNAPAAQGGDVIRTKGLGRQGSLGVNITYQGAYRLLSCAHVLTAFDPQYINKMIEVAPDVSGPFRDLVAVTDHMVVTYYPNEDEPNPVFNQFDLAWADLTPAQGAPAIKQIGVPAGIRAPVVNEQVRIFGAVTQELQTTKVLSVTTLHKRRDQSTTGQNIYTWWQSGIDLDIEDVAFVPGDSGSAVVAVTDNQVVGLLSSIGNLALRAVPL